MPDEPFFTKYKQVLRTYMQRRDISYRGLEKLLRKRFPDRARLPGQQRIHEVIGGSGYVAGKTYHRHFSMNDFLLVLEALKLEMRIVNKRNKTTKNVDEEMPDPRTSFIDGFKPEDFDDPQKRIQYFKVLACDGETPANVRLKAAERIQAHYGDVTKQPVIKITQEDVGDGEQDEQYEDDECPDLVAGLSEITEEEISSAGPAKPSSKTEGLD